MIMTKEEDEAYHKELEARIGLVRKLRLRLTAQRILREIRYRLTEEEDNAIETF